MVKIRYWRVPRWDHWSISPQCSKELLLIVIISYIYMQLHNHKFPKLCSKQKKESCPYYSPSRSFDSGDISCPWHLCNRYLCRCFFTRSWSVFILNSEKSSIQYETPLYHLISWQRQPKARDDIYMSFPAHDCQSKIVSINWLKGFSSIFCCTGIVGYPRR